MSVSAHRIVEGSLVSLNFSLALADGQLIDSNYESPPASFRLGDGTMLPGFEEALYGLKAEDEVEVLLPPDQAFGAINPKNLQRFPAAKFSNLLADDVIPTEVGAVVSFKDAGGFDLPGVISAIDASTIEVDFNHPLAGKAILFKASVTAVLPPDVAAVEIKL